MAQRFVIQRNPTAMPRAYVVPRAVVLPDHPGVVLRTLADLNPKEFVAMTVDPLAGLGPGPRQPFTTAAWTSIDPDRPGLSVSTRAPGLLVIADTWMPGWTATVDGRPVPVLRGNQSQRVIPLPEPGRHVVSLEYCPPGLVSGSAVAILSAHGLGVVVRRPACGIPMAASDLRPLSRQDDGLIRPPGQPAGPGCVQGDRGRGWTRRSASFAATIAREASRPGWAIVPPSAGMPSVRRSSRPLG